MQIIREQYSRLQRVHANFGAIDTDSQCWSKVIDGDLTVILTDDNDVELPNSAEIVQSITSYILAKRAFETFFPK